MDETTKICSKCRLPKSRLTDFHKKSREKDGLYSQCKVCVSEYTRSYYVKNQEELIAKTKRWHHANPEKRKAKDLRWRAANREKHLEIKRTSWAKYPRTHRNCRYKKHYGITIEEYEAMVVAQNGKCAICESDNHRSRKGVGSWPVDHNHKTGKVRGLLCYKCNSGVGQFDDDPEMLIKAAAYLRKHSPETTLPACPEIPLLFSEPFART